MKVAVSAAGTALDAAVHPRFGQCSYFVVVETDDMAFEAIENTASRLDGAIGIQAGQLLANRGIQAVLTGNCGPNARQTLDAAGIEVVVGCSGSVSETIERFKSGQLQPQPPDGSGQTGLTHGGR